MTTNDPANPGPKITVTMPYKVAGLSARKPTRFAFRPNVAERAQIAAAVDLLALPAFSFVGEIRAAGRQDFILEARLLAEAVQPCSISLAPVPASVAEDVIRRFQADFHEPDTEEAEMADADAEPLPEVIDIASVAIESLTLALPLYPRAPGAELGAAVFAPPGVAAIVDADLKPFAGLAGLAARLKTPDSGPS